MLAGHDVEIEPPQFVPLDIALRVCVEPDVFRDAFVSGGISGPVNWYRNIDANAARYVDLLNAPVEQPTLVIAADADPVLPLPLTEGMERWIPNLTRVVIEDCGHWTQQERPDEVNDALVAWLEQTG